MALRHHLKEEHPLDFLKTVAVGVSPCLEVIFLFGEL
jgi:hypothetical protein